MHENNLPLKGITILDLTHARAGPTAVRQLADWGADAIKIEVPVEKDSGQGLGGARHAPDFLNLHRNKRAITLNLKKAQGLEIFMALAENADVIVENFRTEVKHRLGVDYESVRKVNSRIIYGSISGFGQSGPISKRAGVDQIAQGMGGLMSITGLPGQGPVRVGIPIADLTAGMYLAQGILLALIERNQSGEGQWVHTSLLEAQISMLDFQAARWLIDEDVPGQAGNDHPINIPMGAFKTANGAVNIAASSSRLWTRFLETAGAQDLAEHPDFQTAALRSKNRADLNKIIGEIMVERTSEDWIESLSEAGVPCGPINSIDQTFAEPQVKHLGIATPMQHGAKGSIKVVGQPVHLERTPQPAKICRATPELGEHTLEVLTELGYDQVRIDELQELGVI